MISQNQQLSVDFLRENDRDRYLSTLVLAGKERDAISALYAFNADVAAIRSRVSEPTPGEIRLQWWNEALSGGGHGDVQRNPVAANFLDALKAYQIPIGILQRLLGARRFDLYDDPMPDMDSFEGYAGETVSTLYQIAAMILNQGKSIETGDAAGHLGVAQALIGHLRAFGFNASLGRIFLPWSVFVANGVREDEVFSGQASEGVVETLGQLSDIAEAHIAKAEAAIAVLPQQVRPAYASVAVLKLQHKALAKTVASPFATAPDIADWHKIVALLWWSWRKR